MNRRESLALLGGASAACSLAAWPRLARAQSVARIGLLSSPAAISDTSPMGAALTRGLAQRGYTAGRNLAFERRGAEGQLHRLPGLVGELVASKVDVVVTTGYPAARAARQGTILPIVAINAGDPVATGLVDSLVRPGGNLTGISDVSRELTPKRMEFLKLVAPRLKRLAIVWNADDLGMTLRYRATDAAAVAMGIDVLPVGVREPDDFNGVFDAMNREPPDAILMVADSLTNLNRKRVFDYAAARKLPAIYEFASFVRDGGLMSYGPDFDESMDRVAALVDRVLKGARPVDLPFEQPSRFTLAINLKTAKALDIELPPVLLARADETIE